MHQFQLKVISPEKVLVDALTSSIVAPGVDGYLGIQYGHIPMVVALKSGMITYEDSFKRHYIYVEGGYMEVVRANVVVLADRALVASEIDEQEAEASLELARRTLRGEMTDMTTEQALDELEHAQQRLRIARMAQQ